MIAGESSVTMAEGGRLGQRLACESGRVLKIESRPALGTATDQRTAWVPGTDVAMTSCEACAREYRWTCSSFAGALPSRLVARLRETAHVASLPIGLEAQHVCVLL